jgi:uncharacterized protein
MQHLDGLEKEFPENMVPLENKSFKFCCHAGLGCFTKCCTNVDMYLFPYDIIRLKNSVGMHSEEFVRKYTVLIYGDNPYFPSVKMKLCDDEPKSCPFLTRTGCSVYEDRPSSCRTYPLERAVDRNPAKATKNDYYFLTSHPYCLGHSEEMTFNVKDWVRNQKIHAYNLMNDLWTEIESIFMTNPWKGEGRGGPKQQLAFMVCYNIDSFRDFISSHRLLSKFNLSGYEKKNIGTDDAELLKFGFEWLKQLLTGTSRLISR